MIKEYQEFYKVDESTAKSVIDNQLNGIMSFISYDYVKEMDYIDKKINKYYSLYATRILMVLSNNVNLQTYLNKILMTIKDFDMDVKKEFLERLSVSFNLTEHKYVGKKSIERRKKRKPNTKSGAIITSGLSDDEKLKLTEEILYAYPDKYGVKQAQNYFDRLLKNRDELIPDESVVKSRDDAMMVAASIIYSGSMEFPYEVEFLGGTVETGVATISKVKIKRKVSENG